MPLQLKAPLEKELTLELTDKQFGVKGEATKVMIRQATQGAQERRAALFKEVIRETSKNISDDTIRYVQKYSFEELKRIEVFLTMVGSNIIGVDGETLFNYDAKRKISESDFKIAWDKLDPMVCTEIHEKVLEINPDWVPQSLEGEVL